MICRKLKKLLILGLLNFKRLNIFSLDLSFVKIIILKHKLSMVFFQNDRKILCFDLKSESSLLCGKVKKSDKKVEQIFIVVFKFKK